MSDTVNVPLLVTNVASGMDDSSPPRLSAYGFASATSGRCWRPRAHADAAGVSTASVLTPARRLGTPELLPLSLIALMWVVMLVWLPADALRGDVLRFWEIAHAGGRPYVDFPVEYPPLETFVLVRCRPRDR